MLQFSASYKKISSRNFNTLIGLVHYLHSHGVKHSDASADRRSAVSLSPVLLRILFLHANYMPITIMHAGISLRPYPRSDTKL